MRGNGSSDRERRAVAVLDEYLAGRRAGRTVSRSELVARYPDLAPDLEECLKSLDLIAGGERDADNAIIGATLGDFRILREVGRGGMGVVYEATQLSLGRRVALKVLPFAAVFDERHLQRFRNEAQAAAFLHHTNIVPVHAVGCERGVHYYAMQYIEGRSFAQILDELRAPGARKPSSAPLSTITKDRSTESEGYCRAVARLAVQAAEALDHAHERGVVHRDIKPGNLMLDAHGHVWITDFGLASFERNPGLTMTGDVLGTVRYMSPEQAAGGRTPIDHRTDVYSLGATFYELLTLEPTHPGGDPHAVLRAITSEEPTPPRRHNASIPEEVETILLKALAKDPGARYPTAQEMAQDLERFLLDRPILARRPSLAQRAAKWVRRHRTLVTAAAGALLVSTAALAVATVSIAQEQSATAAALRREEAARQRAEEHFRSAMEAVDQLLSEVGERDLADLPLVAPMRRRILERALAFQERFLAATGGTPEARLDAARAHVRVARIRDLLGDPEGALQAAGSATGLLEGLSAPDARRALADACHARATVSLGLDRLAEAEADERHARQLWEGLGGGERDRHDAARSCHGLSLVLSKAGRHADAETEAAAAVAIWQALVDERPDEDDYTWGLAQALQTLAVLVESRGDLKGAIDFGERGRGAWGALTERAPGVERYRAGLARQEGNLGTTLIRAGRLAEALPLLEASIERLAGLVRDNPSAPKHRLFLAQTRSNLGELLRNLNRNEDAERALRDAISAASELVALYPGVPAYRFVLGSTRSNLAHVLRVERRLDEAAAEFQAAAAEQERLVAEHGDVARYRLELARTRKNSAGVLRNLGRWDEAERACRGAVELLEPLATGPEVEPRRLLAETLYAYGVWLIDRGDPRAPDLLRQSAAQWRGVVERDPRPAWRLNFGATLEKTGLIHVARGEFQEAEALFDEARAIFEGCIADGHTGTAFRLNLAVIHEHLAGVYAEIGRGAESLDAWRASLVIRRDAAALDPSQRVDLAQSMVTVADRVVGESRAEAMGLYDEAVRLLEELVNEDAGKRSLSESGRALNNLALRLMEDGQHERAADLLSRAAERQRAALSLDPVNATYRQFLRNHMHSLASCRVRLREHAAAAEAAEEMRATQPALPENHRLAGAYLLDCSNIAREDERLAPDERLRLATGYIQRSYAAYRRATDLAPDNAQWRFELAWNAVRAPCPELRDIPLALEVAREAVDLDPHSSVCLLALGAAQARAGRWDDAVATLDGVGDLDAEASAHQRLFLALALAGKGAKQKAKALLEAAGPPADDVAFNALRAEVEGALGEEGVR